jgi:hypothetical protein
MSPRKYPSEVNVNKEVSSQGQCFQENTLLRPTSPGKNPVKSISLRKYSAKVNTLKAIPL